MHDAARARPIQNGLHVVEDGRYLGGTRPVSAIESLLQRVALDALRDADVAVRVEPQPFEDRWNLGMAERRPELDVGGQMCEVVPDAATHLDDVDHDFAMVIVPDGDEAPNPFWSAQLADDAELLGQRSDQLRIAARFLASAARLDSRFVASALLRRVAPLGGRTTFRGGLGANFAARFGANFVARFGATLVRPRLGRRLIL